MIMAENSGGQIITKMREFDPAKYLDDEGLKFVKTGTDDISVNVAGKSANRRMDRNRSDVGRQITTCSDVKRVENWVF